MSPGAGRDLRQITLPGAVPANGGGAFGFGGAGGGAGQGIAFSPDGQTVAINVNTGPGLMRVGGPAAGGGGGGNMLLLWDVASGKEIRKITLPTGRAVSQLVYSPNGRLLATPRMAIKR